ncbi:hypothetical protein [Micromonospora yangpuensis]|uniref:Uncharacterized protein n=1 Tax=Micromonospora yangpuensis TaxID=683228 RepID=A0A1C6U0L0_9ACTN|nr:hypothetical protein [Micromonospora yangpuensis]GGM11643.1 hypothetical protein GCM10012279_32190 [Micromonospora yangpuensis]SCL47576.1 hypothetical protein GA0070617_0625 [Micromonospora yangpuensis]
MSNAGYDEYMDFLADQAAVAQARVDSLPPSGGQQALISLDNAVRARTDLDPNVRNMLTNALAYTGQAYGYEDNRLGLDQVLSTLQRHNLTGDPLYQQATGVRQRLVAEHDARTNWDPADYRGPALTSEAAGWGSPAGTSPFWSTHLDPTFPPPQAPRPWAGPPLPLPPLPPGAQPLSAEEVAALEASRSVAEAAAGRSRRGATGGAAPTSSATREHHGREHHRRSGNQSHRP